MVNDKSEIANILNKQFSTVFVQEPTDKDILDFEYPDWNNVLSAVPQGSVIGPLLFIICINDLPDSISNVSKMYADDTKVLAKIFYNIIIF